LAKRHRKPSLQSRAAQCRNDKTGAKHDADGRQQSAFAEADAKHRFQTEQAQAQPKRCAEPIHRHGHKIAQRLAAQDDGAKPEQAGSQPRPSMMAAPIQISATPQPALSSFLPRSSLPAAAGLL
jgi:hypothetical protein